MPLQGWDSGPVPYVSPNHTFCTCSDGDYSRAPIEIVGAGNTQPAGVFAQYVVVPRTQVVLTPDHLDDDHAAAWPLAGVTAWR